MELCALLLEKDSSGGHFSNRLSLPDAALVLWGGTSFGLIFEGSRVVSEGFVLDLAIGSGLH